jgi:hypothetical protein
MAAERRQLQYEAEMLEVQICALGRVVSQLKEMRDVKRAMIVAMDASNRPCSSRSLDFEIPDIPPWED